MNKTRWSSRYSMLKRFMELYDFLKDEESLDEFLPTRNQLSTLKRIYSKMASFDSVTKDLQRDDATLCDVRTLFDCVLEDNTSSLGYYIAQDSAITHSKEFENAVVKVQQGQEDSLLDEEKVFLF